MATATQKFSLDDLADAKLGDVTEAQIVGRAKDFVADYVVNNSEGGRDPKIYNLFRDLLTGNFWGALALIDGCNNRMQPEPVEKRQKAREWAQQHFGYPKDRLGEILHICTDWALRAEVKSGWPGTYHGHEILYRELVEKTDSMFFGAVDARLRKRLNNGRFWEMLPEMSTSLNYGIGCRIVDDVLTENFNDLDVDFAPYGMKLFERNCGKTRGDCFDIDHLSKDGRANYGDFILEIHQNRKRLGLKISDLAHIVRPYIEAALSTDEDGNNLLRQGIYNLREPWLKEYLAEMPDVIKNCLAGKLYLEVMYGHDSDIGRVVEVLRNLPKPKQILDQMVEQSHSKHSAAELITRFNKAGYNITQIVG